MLVTTGATRNNGNYDAPRGQVRQIRPNTRASAMELVQDLYPTSNVRIECSPENGPAKMRVLVFTRKTNERRRVTLVAAPRTPYGWALSTDVVI